MKTHTSTTTVAAETLLTELLSAGPMRPRDVKSVAAQRGLHVSEEGWSHAKRRLGVETTHVGGPVWHWSLPEHNLEAELAEWLDTPQGRFEQYAAERDRLRDTPAGVQLKL